MPNIRLTIEYDGYGFHGWQRQKDVRSVQGALEECLEGVLGEPVNITGAGRTDAGCHAEGQVANFMTSSRVSLEKMAGAINGLMKGEVVVREISLAPDGFNSRFSATSRNYRYLVARRPTALWRGRVWEVRGTLDEKLLAGAAASIEGAHDFTAFSKKDERTERNPMCLVERAEWSEWELGLCFEIRADRFLQAMVRLLVGTMVRVGSGRTPPACVKELIEGSSGEKAGPAAPARGLCLVAVDYGSTGGDGPGQGRE